MNKEPNPVTYAFDCGYREGREIGRKEGIEHVINLLQNELNTLDEIQRGKYSNILEKR